MKYIEYILYSQTKEAGNYPSFCVGNQEVFLYVFLNLHNIHNLIILFSLIYKSLELALKTKR